MTDVVSKFLRYVAVNTISDFYGNPGNTPSTQCQFDLAYMLLDELKALGIEDARLDPRCYVYGSLPATPGCEDLPAIGFITHMDTSPELSGENVKPQTVHYEGGDIVLNEKLGIVMRAADFPMLGRMVGHDIICTDGTTLLGADDKDGIAIVMQALEEIIASGKPHGKICVGFTPDEEIGRGASNFDVEGFGADFAYTLDGGAPNEYHYETFNAARAEVNIQGLGIHTGSAKDQMKNAILMAQEFNALLPALETPGHTEGYQGFYHLLEMNGTVENARLVYNLRDHDMGRFEQRKQTIREAARQIELRYGEGRVKVEITDHYYNMYEILKDRMEILDLVVGAMKAAGVDGEPVHLPIRGGTDGCLLTYKGLPCPNIPSSGYHAHGRYECVSIQELTKCVEVVHKILDPEVIRAHYRKKETV